MNREDRMMQDLMDILQEKVVIPEVVLERAEEAFAAVRRDAECEGNVRGNVGQAESLGRRRRRGSRKGKFAVVLIAAVLAFGTISAAAVYMVQSRSLREELQMTQQQQEKMQETHMASFAGQSSTVQGITVTALDSITDQYFTHIAFRVEGYQAEDGEQPDFENVTVTVGGQKAFNYSGSFYNGIIAGSDGRPVYADGSALQTDAGGRLAERYALEDGSMEYRITLFNMEKKGFFINKPVHVELNNLGTVAKAAFQPSVAGTWAFDWDLKGSPEIRSCELNAPLGDSGASVLRVELSPVSLAAEYEFPRREMQESYQDQNGQTKMGTFYSEPPVLRGIRMKDGTVYPNVYLGPGGSGYESEESSVYRVVFAVDRILDVDQVESLLFLKQSQTAEGASLEEQYYTVPIG